MQAIRIIKLPWIWFIAVESFAALAWATFQLAGTSLFAVFLWFCQFFLLLPGSLAATVIVQGPLWSTGLRLEVLNAIHLALSLLFNAAFYAGILWVVRRAIAALRSNNRIERAHER